MHICLYGAAARRGRPAATAPAHGPSHAARAAERRPPSLSMSQLLNSVLPQRPIALVAMDSFCPLRGGQGSTSVVDVDYVKYQAKYHADNCVDMVILQGTTGEWPALSVDERLALAAAWRAAVPVGSALKLILHVGCACSSPPFRDSRALGICVARISLGVCGWMHLPVFSFSLPHEWQQA